MEKKGKDWAWTISEQTWKNHSITIQLGKIMNFKKRKGYGVKMGAVVMATAH